MKYSDGNEVHIGDEVEVDCDTGIVVAILSDGVFSAAYPKADWSYLKMGLLYISNKLGLTLVENVGSVRLRPRTDTQKQESQSGSPHAA